MLLNSLSFVIFPRSSLADLCVREFVYKSGDGYLVYESLFGEWLAVGVADKPISIAVARNMV